MLIKKEIYGIDIEEITLDDINNILTSKIVQEPELPFRKPITLNVLSTYVSFIKSKLTKDEKYSMLLTQDKQIIILMLDI